jgi:DNA-binding CsgD family transcriptional regulator
MSLLNGERRYVAVNDAMVKLYQWRSDELIGARADRAIVDGDKASVDAAWELLLRSGELYGERLIAAGGGSLLRVCFAAHATTVAGRWFALFVTVSARNQDDDRELIGTRQLQTPDDVESNLTRREREVVQLIARGASTVEIAAELGLSDETVRAHVRNAREKTQTRTRAQLVAMALASGLIDT